jgi:hypothetical protein
VVGTVKKQWRSSREPLLVRKAKRRHLNDAF